MNKRTEMKFVGFLNLVSIGSEKRRNNEAKIIMDLHAGLTLKYPIPMDWVF
jgi:hypothetical protein